MRQPKYKVGDIIKLNTVDSFRREILYICCPFDDDHWYSKEICYYTKIIGNDSYPPSYMEESTIDKYYTKVIIDPEELLG